MGRRACLCDGEQRADQEVDAQQRAVVARADAAEERVAQREAAQDDETTAATQTKCQVLDRPHQAVTAGQGSLVQEHHRSEETGEAASAGWCNTVLVADADERRTFAQTRLALSSKGRVVRTSRVKNLRVEGGMHICSKSPSPHRRLSCELVQDDRARAQRWPSRTGSLQEAECHGTSSGRVWS